MHLAELAFRLRTVPSAAFVDLLREAGEPMDAKALKLRLESLGVEKDMVDAAWRKAQPGVKRHGNVEFDATHGKYRWSSASIPPPTLVLTPTQALESLVTGRVPAVIKPDLVELVRRALDERDALEARLRAGYQGTREARAALERQIRIDAARAVAEVAMEVEELAAAGADATVTVERIRGLAKAFELEPIGRAGEEVAFRPATHSAIGGYPPNGSMVVVIRPGYSWRTGDDDVLVAKAQVAAVSAGR